MRFQHIAAYTRDFLRDKSAVRDVLRLAIPNMKGGDVFSLNAFCKKHPGMTLVVTSKWKTHVTHEVEYNGRWQQSDLSNNYTFVSRLQALLDRLLIKPLSPADQK